MRASQPIFLAPRAMPAATDRELSGCLNCSGSDLQVRSERPWPWIIFWLLVGLGGAWFTYGASLAIAAYPLWVLWVSAPRGE